MLDAIKNNDASLQASLANIEDDNGLNNKREDFVKAAVHMLPKDSVPKKRNVATKHTAADICDSTVSQTASGGGKQGIGATRLHLRYYKPKEYLTLNSCQKGELKKWREDNGHFSGKNNKKNRRVIRGRGGNVILRLRISWHSRTIPQQMKIALKRTFCP